MKSVSVAPGLTQLTETGVRVNSCRNPRLKLTTDALDAAYRLSPGMAW